MHSTGTNDWSTSPSLKAAGARRANTSESRHGPARLVHAHRRRPRPHPLRGPLGAPHLSPRHKLTFGESSPPTRRPTPATPGFRRGDRLASSRQERWPARRLPHLQSHLPRHSCTDPASPCSGERISLGCPRRVGPCRRLGNKSACRALLRGHPVHATCWTEPSGGFIRPGCPDPACVSSV